LRIEQLREACGLRFDLLAAFIELQLRAALAGNGISPPARRILMRAAERLGMQQLEFARLEAAVRARYAGARPGGQAGGQSKRPLSDCYAELEVSAGASDAEVIKAYRRQMSRHHPDKLVANGLPESMAEWAKEKTQRIQESYEAIRAARGMR
jgi:DnaJ like chaperone protein